MKNGYKEMSKINLEIAGCGSSSQKSLKYKFDDINAVSYTHLAPNIVLVEGQRDGGAFLKWEETLFVYDDNGNYSEEINRIYGRK